MNDVKVEIQDTVSEAFERMSWKELHKVYSASMRTGANMLVRQAKKNLALVVRNPQSINWWNGKMLQSGIVRRPLRDNELGGEIAGEKVHIMGDFRLKFFENSTKERQYFKIHQLTSIRNPKTGRRKAVVKASEINKGHRTGRIKASHFFTNAMDQTESRVFGEAMNRIEKNIIKKWKA